MSLNASPFLCLCRMSCRETKKTSGISKRLESEVTVQTSPTNKLQWNLPERPPLLCDHLTKIPIGSSVSQIAISETFRKRPPKPDIKVSHLWEVPLYKKNLDG